MPELLISKKNASIGLASYKSEIGFFVGIALGLIIWIMPTPTGLALAGQRTLALSLVAVVWWATNVVHPGFTALLLLMGFTLLELAPPDTVFRVWTTPMMYLVVGGFLIATAVQISGLGKRIAYLFIIKYVNSFKSVIISCYVLGFLLSFLIPQPWPRSFLIMSVMSFIIAEANLPRKDAANIGLAVFAGSASTSMILLTGDSTLNIAAVEFAGQSISWLEWLYYMGIPGVVTSATTCAIQLQLFKPTVEFSLNKERIRECLAELGQLSRVELKTVFWIGVAVVMWSTDTLHQINPSWVALGVAIALSLPMMGGVLNAKSWQNVNIGTLFFLTAALAIGTVGAETGLNSWIASAVLPAQVPSSPYVFAALTAAVTIVLHMILGSVLAVMGIVAPALVGYAASTGMNPLVPALLVYTAVAMHWILPFHHMNILVGTDAEGCCFTDADVAKLGLPLTLVVFAITVFVQVPWWSLIGLID